MGAAISLLVILTLSVLIIRIASVALRHTGLPDDVARFQARSAFTGAGFTTAESEEVVNYPNRRRIISLLMVVGNLGLVSVMATLIVSLVNADSSMQSVMHQIFWLLGVLVVLWLIALNRVADRLMCDAIGRLLRRFGDGAAAPVTLVQLADGISVREHRLGPSADLAGRRRADVTTKAAGLTLLGIHQHGGRYVDAPEDALALEAGDVLILYGHDNAHESFAGT